VGSPAASIFAAGPGLDRRIALTFDDGPAASTEAVLDALSAEDARAMFFIVVREPETLSHELIACADELERAVGERPQLVRPPFGGDAGRTARAAAKHGLGPVVLWTVLCFDWYEDARADSIAERAVAEAHPGAIICLHDGDGKDATVNRDATVAALPVIVQVLRRDGYELVTVSELLR
jgi:peptidoglycan-N-acetylglucosamine deacetylase